MLNMTLKARRRTTVSAYWSVLSVRVQSIIQARRQDFAAGGLKTTRGATFFIYNSG